MPRRRDMEIGNLAFDPESEMVFRRSLISRVSSETVNIGKWTIHRFILFTGRVLHALPPEDMLTITERITPVKVV
jgi:hypothetical protein